MMIKLAMSLGTILILATLSQVRPTVAENASTLPAFTAGPPTITAETAIVLDDTSHQILYAKDHHKRVAPASLTKMVTAMVALERGTLSDSVEVDVDSEMLAAETGSSVMGLMPGDVLTVEQLIYGLLLPSGGDAAIAIARHIAGSESRFVEMMNQKVRELGLKDTHFINSHGLDDEGHYSTAYDMAIVARTAMQYPVIAKVVATRKTKIRVSESKEYELVNFNPLLGRYRGADGVKPGYTDNAQLAIAATAKRGDRRLYAVIIRSADLIRDSSRLFDYYFPLPVLISPRTTALFPLVPANR